MFFQDKIENWMISNDRITRKLTGFIQLIIFIVAIVTTGVSVFRMMNAPDQWWGILVIICATAGEGAMVGYYAPRSNPNCKVKVRDEMRNLEYVIMSIGYQFLSILVHMLSALPVAIIIGAGLKFLFTRH